MNQSRRLLAAVLFVTIVALAAWLSRREPNAAKLSDRANTVQTTTVATPTPLGAANQNQMSNKKVSTPPPPCWFTEYDKSYQGTDFYEERIDRMNNGYAKDTSVSEAVKQFNEEMRCHKAFDSFPLLTEGEVVATAANAVVADKDGDEDLIKRNRNLRRVVEEKVLAKGLLLRYLSEEDNQLPPTQKRNPDVIEQFVYLYTGLDDNGMLCCVTDKQKSLIRKLIHHTEPKK